ncbi:MAG: DUF1573 domain-containing protein [Bacteroidales bacterium]|nr:DUF1573 domain-containing protein [Bacteroidales bacterium]
MRVQLIAAMAMMAMTIGTTGCADTPEEKAKEHGQEIWFEAYMHDYGQIEEDSDGTWSFAFKNLGEESIVINRVRSTCGCTVPVWPREPIEPGASGEIAVKYNTARTGTFMKSVVVYSTAANSPVKLQIKGKVIPK